MDSSSSISSNSTFSKLFHSKYEDSLNKGIEIILSYWYENLKFFYPQGIIHQRKITDSEFLILKYVINFETKEIIYGKIEYDSINHILRFINCGPQLTFLQIANLSGKEKTTFEALATLFLKNKIGMKVFNENQGVEYHLQDCNVLLKKTIPITFLNNSYFKREFYVELSGTIENPLIDENYLCVQEDPLYPIISLYNKSSKELMDESSIQFLTSPKHKGKIFYKGIYQYEYSELPFGLNILKDIIYFDNRFTFNTFGSYLLNSDFNKWSKEALEFLYKEMNEKGDNYNPFQILLHKFLWNLKINYEKLKKEEKEEKLDVNGINNKDSLKTINETTECIYWWNKAKEFVTMILNFATKNKNNIIYLDPQNTDLVLENANKQCLLDLRRRIELKKILENDKKNKETTEEFQNYIRETEKNFYSSLVKCSYFIFDLCWRYTNHDLESINTKLWETILFAKETDPPEYYTKEIQKWLEGLIDKNFKNKIKNIRLLNLKGIADTYGLSILDLGIFIKTFIYCDVEKKELLISPLLFQQPWLIWKKFVHIFNNIKYGYTIKVSDNISYLKNYPLSLETFQKTDKWEWLGIILAYEINRQYNEFILHIMSNRIINKKHSFKRLEIKDSLILPDNNDKEEKKEETSTFPSTYEFMKSISSLPDEQVYEINSFIQADIMKRNSLKRKRIEELEKEEEIKSLKRELESTKQELEKSKKKQEE